MPLAGRLGQLKERWTKAVNLTGRTPSDAPLTEGKAVFRFLQAGDRRKSG